MSESQVKNDKEMNWLDSDESDEEDDSDYEEQPR